MNKEEMLSQLEGIREHCKIMIPQDEPDSVWRGDVEALDMAISELRQETNMAEIDHVKPLTLEELRQMDGEPVWIEADHYGVYADVVRIQGQEDGKRYVHFKINWRLQENGCGKTWLAYRHKPKEEV